MLTIVLTIIGYRAALAVTNTGPAGSLRERVGVLLGGRRNGGPGEELAARNGGPGEEG